MMLPEMTSSARVARAFQRFARGALVGLALGALAGCDGGGGGGTSTPAKTTQTPEMSITPAVTVKPDYESGVSVNVVDGTAGWRSQPLGSYFDSPDNTQLRFAVAPYTGATAEIRDSRLVVGAVTSSRYVVAVTATSAMDPANRASLMFRFTIGPEEETGGGNNGGSNGGGNNGGGNNGESNSAPAITNPGDRQYTQRETITAFGITVSDADSDTLTVGVSGLPTGLTYSLATGMVSGTVSATAPVRLYTVTVTANDGIGDVTRDFNFRVYHRILTSDGNVIQSPLGPSGTVSSASSAAAQMSARQSFNSSPPSGWTSALSAATASNLAATAAGTACTGMTPSLQLTSNSVFVGTFTWGYSNNLATGSNQWQYQARRVHPWAARCQ